MNYLHICLAARVAHGDLVAIDAELEGGAASHAIRMILIKSAMVTLANVADLEVECRALYKLHPELSDAFRPKLKQFEFAKYLRNKFVGHMHPDLSTKAMEWKPELNALLADSEKNSELYMSYAVLETAINTFVDNLDKHRLFETETDLNYPPDMQRYLNFLGDTVHAAIAFTEKLAKVAVVYADPPSYDDTWLELAKKAGKTEFKYLSKSGR